MGDNKNTGIKRVGAWKKHVSESEKEKMIAACACRIAEERGFENFKSEQDPIHDWELATEEVNKFLAENL
ncbi:MAG: hypothetical protein A2381_14385 [Bdellovibrionales bacterium RIFOXYB1_FULL_37_110]|nr:MAG: hypothetical protein A2417_07155 [Bdellovibrionales bacterium RIFOXYC1_FULL_37_79]OFZ57530.1 MAG: hypothetical protein A2381_14385 [Bdellovibrionales bacterium RIFOXYB1_FULL_37_110]OFZ63001.1 MAG: hypothetical protein A2577_07665 [Bdellovibrionales bacterium RIFOXYD1_FULL_36_51]